MAADVGDVFEDDAALVGALQDQLVDRALADDGVAVRAQAGVQQQLGDVLEPDSGAVEQVLAFARAVQAARDADLVVLDRQTGVGVVEDQRHLGHTQGLRGGRAGEDDLFGLAGAHSLGGLFAEDPQQGVGDVGLAAAVGADDDDDAGLELGGDAGCEGLEADEVEAAEIQGWLEPYRNWGVRSPEFCRD